MHHRLAVAATIAATLAAPASAGKGPSGPPTADARALAQAQALTGLPPGVQLTLLGHVTPSSPVDRRQVQNEDQRVALQLGTLMGSSESRGFELRWDAANGFVSLPSSTATGAQIVRNPYAGLLFTIRAGYHYVVYCTQTRRAAAVAWNLQLSPPYPPVPGGPRQMPAGTAAVAFVVEPITGDGGYANLHFAVDLTGAEGVPTGEDVTNRIDACWLFDFPNRR